MGSLVETVLSHDFDETLDAMKNIDFFIRDVKNGYLNGYPMCCVVQFASEQTLPLAKIRGSPFRHKKKVYVMCDECNNAYNEKRKRKIERF